TSFLWASVSLMGKRSSGFLVRGMASLRHVLIQQCLNFLPLPQGQGSLRPILVGLVDPGIGRGGGFLATSLSCSATLASSFLLANCCSASWAFSFRTSNPRSPPASKASFW